MKCTVLGGGEIGTACALALAAAKKTNSVTVYSRQADAMPTEKNNRSRAVFPVFRGPELPIPRNIAFEPLSQVGKRPEGCGEALFLCGSCPALLQPENPWCTGALGGVQPTTSFTITQTLAAQQAPALAAVFARGLTPDAVPPVQLVQEALDSVAASDKATAVLVATGPLRAQEWALNSAASLGPAVDCENLSPADIPCISTRFSGTALSFACFTPAAAADAGRMDALDAQLQEMFPRESVEFLRGADDASLLAIINGCLPLCAFGAGMVSNFYVGASTSALASYTQHALRATEALVNIALQRAKGTPLPIAATVAISFGCNNFASREFALGRRMDYYFRRQDAVEAVYPVAAHLIFEGSVDGLHTLLKRHMTESPFYEVLMDSFNTVIRASCAGEGLVKEGYYDYRTIVEGGQLLHHTMRVDDAMLSGDETRFTQEKDNIMKAFPSATF